MIFKSWDQIRPFCDYVEKHTRLFEMCHLGYPWYLIAKETWINSLCDKASSSLSDKVRESRLQDFYSKTHLLNKPYDNAIFVKAKMRRQDPAQYENHLFGDIFDYLINNKRSFIIFEEPDGDLYDLKYMRSKFADITIPYEFMLSFYKGSINQVTSEAIRLHNAIVEQLFQSISIPEIYKAHMLALKKIYHQLSGNISKIVLTQILLKKMKAKALLGGMGTHYNAGFKNPFAVVEVGHGLNGKTPGDTVSHYKQLLEFQQKEFNLKRYFSLELSHTAELGEKDQICLDGNRFNYGMPEIRAFRYSPNQLDHLKKKYKISDQPVILITTSGWIDYHAFDKWITEIRSHFQDVKILLRPHPSYEDKSKHRKHELFLQLATQDKLYDLFSLANVVISSPSSVVFEAWRFTENIIVFPDKDMTSVKSLSRKYPFASPIFLEDTELFIKQIEKFLSEPRKKNPSIDPVDYKGGLEKLFKDNLFNIKTYHKHSQSGTQTSKKKKIVVMQGGFPALSITFIIDMMCGLIDHGFEIENWALYVPEETKIHKKIEAYNLISKTKYIRIPSEKLKPEPLFWAEEFCKLNGIDYLDEIDAFHIHYGVNYLSIEPLLKTLDKFVLVSFHGYDASRYFKENGDTVYNSLFRQASMITTPSYYMKNELTKRGCPPLKIKVHRYGVDCNQFNFKGRVFKKNQVVLLTVARLVEKKGIEYALKALAQINTKIDFIYKIIGHGPLKQKLIGLIEKLKLNEKVQFLGALSSEDVTSEMQKADIFVLTSITAADGDQEGVPVSLTEAQIDGLPAVSSLHAGIPELVFDGKTGYLSEEKDINAISKNIQILMENDNIREEFSKNTQSLIREKFDINKLNKTLSKYFTEGIKSKTLANRYSNVNLKVLMENLQTKNWAYKKNFYEPVFEYVQYRKIGKTLDIAVVVISSRLSPDNLTSFKILEKQRDQNFELIFVDNGGKVGEFNALKPFIDIYVKLNTNTGAYLARNVGALFAKAPILFFLEDDGIPTHDLIRAHLQAFKKYDMIACRGVCSPKTENSLNKIAGHYYLGNKPFPIYADIEGNTSYLAEIFFKAGGWDDEISFGGGGVDLSRRLLNVEPDHRKQIYLPDAVIYHDYASNESHLQSKQIKQNKSRQRLRKKHRDYDAFLASWIKYRGKDDLLIKRNTPKQNIADLPEVLISILIPTYNREKYIAQAIESALAQCQKNIEIVVVDDGSTDSTKKILKEFESEKLRYFCKNHTGAPDTRNSAIEKAKGQYLLWLDSDDVLMPGAIAKYTKVISDFPEVDVHYGNLVIVDSSGNFRRDQIYPDYYEQNNVLLSRLFIGNSIPNGGTLIRKSVYQTYGGYSLRYKRAHDYEFWVRVARQIKFKHVEAKVYKWRWHDSNMSSGSVQFDNSYEIQIKKDLLKSYTLKELFPQLNWNNENKSLEAAYFAIGNSFNLLKDYQEATEYYEKCIEINKCIDYYYALVLAYFRLNNLEKSLSALNDLLIISPENKNAREMYENLMKILITKNQKQQINAAQVNTDNDGQHCHAEGTGPSVSGFVPTFDQPKSEDSKTFEEKFSITAIVAAYNEGDVIYHVIRDLVEQDIQVVFIDHHSSDNTLEEVRKWEGKGVVRIESFPEDAGLDIPRNVYSWRYILRRKQDIATEMGPGWYLHADADEFREAPWLDLSLREGIERVDREGFNAIDFKIYDFKPTNNDFEPGQDVRKYLIHYDPDIHVFNNVQIKCWKNFGQEVNLWGSGGHAVAFEGRKVYPVPFVLRHYAARSQRHGLQKVFQDRKARFDKQEREARWHDQYDQVVDTAHSFLRDETELIRYDREKACREVQSASSFTESGYYGFSRPEVQAMVSPDARVILDVGCASGRMAGEIKSKLMAEVWGIEPVEKVACLAERVLDRIIVAPVEQAILELPDGYFDCIIFADVLEHLQDPAQVLIAIQAKLKPTGEIVASIPNVRHWSVVKDLLEGSWEYTDSGILDRTHLKFFTRQSVQNLFRRTGYDIRDMQATSLNAQNVPAELVQGMEKSGLRIGTFVEEASHYQYLVKGGLPPLATTLQKPRPMVSIIILTFNALDYTKKCVNSIRKHTHYPHEIIFVDNASADGTKTYLNKLLKFNDNCRLIANDENLGFAAGNNQGIEAARGDYFLLMNNDIVVTPGWLERMVSCAERDPMIGIVGPMSNYVSGPQLVKDITYNVTDLGGLDDFAAEFSKRNAGKAKRYLRVVGFCMLIKRAVINKIGGLDDRYGLGNFEDDDFSLRAALAGFESWMAQDCFIHHFGNCTFIGAKIDYRESLTKNWEIFKNKWGLPTDLQLGSNYNWAQILKEGFVLEKHCCPLNQEGYVETGQKDVSSLLSDAGSLKELYQKVQRLVNDGRQEEAIGGLERLLKMDPDFAIAHNDLGILYYNQGDKEKALNHYEQAVRIEPHNLTFQKNLADFYFVESGRVEDALTIYNKVLEADFGDVEALMSMGLICKVLERPEDARHFYNRVLENEPWNVDARQQLENL